MRYRYVHYNLGNGYIHNWLVAGPQEIPINLINGHKDQFQREILPEQIIQQYYQPTSGITKTPVERGPLDKGLFQIGDYSGSWNYYACREDHFIDHSHSGGLYPIYPDPHYLRSWAYTQLSSKTTQDVWIKLTTSGLADIWLNGQHIHRQEHSAVTPSVTTPIADLHSEEHPFKVTLVNGINKMIVRFESVALGAFASRWRAHAMALQVCKGSKDSDFLANESPAALLQPYPAKAGIHVTIPTLIQAISRRNNFERVSATAYTLQDVFEGPSPIQLYWPADLEETSYTTVRLVAHDGQFYAEADVDGTPGDRLSLNYPFVVPEGPFRIVMMPRPWEFYEKNTRISREISCWNLGRHQFSSSAYGTFTERRQEALISAARRKGLFAEIAKMALNQCKTVKCEDILQAAQKATPLELIGLLGMIYRYNDLPEFPKELEQSVKECILSNRYDKPKNMEGDHSEGYLILSYACEILAGQRFAEYTFQSSGKTGQWHRENGEKLALEWLQQRSATGFADWDSSSSFAEVLTALSHLVDLAQTETIWEMASVVMDKIFLTIALNSFQGVFGSTHGRTYASSVKGGFLEPTSGIGRLMWGVGIFNHHIAAPVSLANMSSYELPAILSEIAIAKPEEIWSRERHAVSAGRVVNKVTYKTPDFMLCSAQNYYPGEMGRLEHIWQATLGPAATIFVNHPACSSEDDARQPNFWAGNAILPSVAQWKDTLIAVYHLPANDWMGFTHAYFPTYAFDEHTIRDGWAFARKGQGYLALKASQGFHQVQRGLYAFRELRSYGQDNIWLCHLGRAALDGDFDAFQRKILSLTEKYEEQSITCTTLRGETLSYCWQGPFLRDGQEQPIDNFEHYENPYVIARYPCTQMDIQLGEDLLRLDFTQ